MKLSMANYLLPPIHPEGWRFIPLFAAAAAGLFYLYPPLGWLGTALTLWCIAFFRNPDRTTPVGPGLVISPADGIVQMIVPAAPPPELEMGDTPCTRVSVFMSVFNCHVNRIPADGRIVKSVYRPGKFFNASLDKASADNERQSVRLVLPDGREIAFVQIAGLVARRIRCDLVASAVVRAGERFGLIRFGSRLDVYLPEGVMPLVAVGQTAIAGETVLADLFGVGPARVGEVR
ncbi:MAG: phosphatidylserine decarboxylase [Alphaproteobacteria bacterium]|nr:phosphatidylserine decarboxylase [Alphaproteobacteria bacterium]